MAHAFHMPRPVIKLLTREFADAAGDPFHVGRGITGADDEEIANGIGNVTKVE